jgi:hypothetical protein
VKQGCSDLATLAAMSFDHDSDFDRFGSNNFWMRFLVFLNDLSVFFVGQSRAAALRVRDAVPLLLHLYQELGIDRPDIFSFISESAIEVENIAVCEVQQMLWSNEELPREASLIPNMLYEDAMRYYHWLGRTLDPVGAAVELGCWMGCSTACLAAGLRQNSLYRDRKLYVFDSFVWQDWMTRYTIDPVLHSRFRAGESFIVAFWEYCQNYADLLEVSQSSLCIGQSDGAIPLLKWQHGPIGLLIVDHSDAYDINAKAWEVFSPHFVPAKTVVVFNQYGNLRAEHLRRFCRDQQQQLIPLHTLVGAGRSFLFRGIATAD